MCEKKALWFRSFGVARRRDAKCPHCGSLERHRLLWVFLQDNPPFHHSRILHIAPEPCFIPKLRELAGHRYVTCDIIHGRAELVIDLTLTRLPSNTFDIIICNHVLEHITDDTAAMSEIHRILKPGGSAFITVPVTAGKTWDCELAKTETDRLQLFGHKSHVRRYGYDFKDKLEAAGLTVRIYKTNDLLTDKEAIRYGLSNAKTGDIYYCTK